MKWDQKPCIKIKVIFRGKRGKTLSKLKPVKNVSKNLQSLQSIYSPLSESSNVELPNRLKNSKRDLINIKNDDNKCFLWFHVWNLNLLKTHP